MNDEWGLFWLVAVVGLVGSFLIFRFTRGLRTVLGCMGWFVLPFVIIAFVLVAEQDASLSADRVQYNFFFGFALLSLIVAVPWLLANLVGAILGAIFRKGKPAPGYENIAAAPAEKHARPPD